MHRAQLTNPIESAMDRKRRSVRLPEYDYASPGAYLVTICTVMKSDLFGNVLADGTMELNGCGQIVRDEWLRTAELRTNVDLDEYVIMPDHFHGIVILKYEGTVHRAPTPESFSRPVPASLPTVVRYFKSAVTRRIRELSGDSEMVVWQRGYHEHVIRKNEDLNRVREYIMKNMLRWSLREKQ